MKCRGLRSFSDPCGSGGVSPPESEMNPFRKGRSGGRPVLRPLPVEGPRVPWDPFSAPYPRQGNLSRPCLQVFPDPVRPQILWSWPDSDLGSEEDGSGSGRR